MVPEVRPAPRLNVRRANEVALLDRDPDRRVHLRLRRMWQLEGPAVFQLCASRKDVPAGSAADGFPESQFDVLK